MNAEKVKVNNPIEGLTADKVNWSLFDRYVGERSSPKCVQLPPLIESIEDVERRALTGVDFYLEALTAREKVKSGTEGYFLEPEFSTDVVEFLKKNRPQTRFFNPQDILFLKSEPGVKFYHEQGKKAECEYWRFATKPFNIEESSLFLTLSRGKVPWLRETEPYLIVSFFPVAYADGNVIFSPHVENSLSPFYLERTEPNDTQVYTSDHKKWEKKIIDGLGLKKHVVKQELKFEVNELDVKISLKKS